MTHGDNLPPSIEHIDLAVPAKTPVVKTAIFIAILMYASTLFFIIAPIYANSQVENEAYLMAKKYGIELHELTHERPSDATLFIYAIGRAPFMAAAIVNFLFALFFHLFAVEMGKINRFMREKE